MKSIWSYLSWQDTINPLTRMKMLDTIKNWPTAEKLAFVQDVFQNGEVSDDGEQYIVYSGIRVNDDIEEELDNIELSELNAFLKDKDKK